MTNVKTENIARKFQEALHCHQAGKLRQAEELYRAILEMNPRHHGALHFLGVAACQAKNYDDAIRLMNQSIEFEKNIPDYYINLANAYHEKADMAAVVSCYRQALALNPRDAETHARLGSAYRKLGKNDEAVASCQSALALNPRLAKAHNNLGNVYLAQGRTDEASACYRRALTIDDRFAEAHYNLGNVFKAQNKITDAIHCYRNAFALQPHSPETINNLGSALLETGKLEEALDMFQRALRIHPEHAEAHYNLGNVYREYRRISEAIECYRRALTLRPGMIEALNNVGLALSALGKFSEALEYLQQAQSTKPDDFDTQINVGAILTKQGKVSEAMACYQKILAAQPGNALACSSLLLTLNYAEHNTPHDNLVAHAAFNAQYEKSAGPMPARHDRSNPGRKLRIGYVSPDFRRHSVACFIEPVLAHHDHEKFSVSCYYNNSIADAVTERLKRHADQWTDCFGISDDELAEIIRRDKIDILVDLAGHTERNRLPVFARKPAPVQVAYLGYPTTTGFSAIDYRLTDSNVDPEGYEKFNVEIPVRLPYSYFCYRPPVDSPPVAESAVTHAGHITFGSFNNYAKISASTLKTWAGVLTACPGSKLFLKSLSLADPAVRRTVIDTMVQAGISADRIILDEWRPSLAAHLTLYNNIDIALDTFPYNGATTTCEALWMGVPVVTLTGQTHASRMGLSILAALGLKQLSASTAEEYVNICAGLAFDTARLEKLRSGLREKMKTSPLMDEVAFVRNLERAYIDMWGR